MIHVKDNGEFNIIPDINYDIVFNNKMDYEFIYISIGSKINEEKSNAYFQMFPTFLQNKKSLVICIDDFSESSFMIMENKKAIKEHKLKYNCDIFIVNGYFNHLEFIKIFSILFEKLRDVNVDKYLIASYIRFRNEVKKDYPEKMFFENYMLSINTLLQEPSNIVFLDNFYLWCGYNNKFLNNIITSLRFYYENKNFEMIYNNSLSKNNTIVNILNNYLSNGELLNCENIKIIYSDILTKTYINYNIKNKQTFLRLINLFVTFCKKSIDICCVSEYSELFLINNDTPLMNNDTPEIIVGGVKKFGKDININSKIKDFYNKVKKYKIEDIIYIDETSIKSLQKRNRCYSNKGKRCVIKTQSQEVFKKYTGVFAISVNGVVNWDLYEKGGINTDRLIKFLEHNITSKLRNKLIILDNASAHRNEMIKALVNKHNNLLYTIPYQHFTNSIENYFSMLKSQLQKLDGLKYENLKENIQKVISGIPKEKYENIFKGAYERPEKYVSTNKTRKNKKKV
jgi:hypothetical protein